MEDIFKSKEDTAREEKIDNLFKSAKDFKKEDIPTIPEKEIIAEAESEKKKENSFWIILSIVLIAGLVGAAGYFFWQYKKAIAVSQSASDEIEAIVEKVGAMMELPKEMPALATIVDQEKIVSQPFFAKALKGDKVLLYAESQEAILYRPSSNEIVETTPLFFESAPKVETQCANQAVQEPATKIESKVKVDVLNGTEIKGLAKETAAKISGMENVELAKVGNTQKSTYTKILVIDLSGKNAVAAKIIAAKVGGEVGALPEGENKGTADILIIAGK